MGIDENYVIPTKVTISSMLYSSKSGAFFEIHIFCNRELSNVGRDKLTELEEKHGQLQLFFHEIADSLLEGASTTAHISVASYYRLYISKFIKADRCLWVDGDMLISEDLYEVYNIDLDGFYVAGIRDMTVRIRTEEFLQYAEYLQIPTMDEYINAGFTLFNIRQIRKDGLDEKFISSISTGYKYMDQDIINKYCYGKIKHLPLKYNFLAEYAGSAVDSFRQYFFSWELESLERNICIRHFTGSFKPWLCTRLKVNQLWWQEAMKVLEEKEYYLILESAYEWEKKSDWTYILDCVKKEKNIIIFGFSKIGKNIEDLLEKAKVSGTIIFTDNDEGKIGLEYHGIPVVPVEEINFQILDPFWIISSQNGYLDIARQLCNLGIGKERMLRYILKDKTYYERLDEKYLDDEIRMIIEYDYQGI